MFPLLYVINIKFVECCCWNYDILNDLNAQSIKSAEKNKET